MEREPLLPKSLHQPRPSLAPIPQAKPTHHGAHVLAHKVGVLLDGLADGAAAMVGWGWGGVGVGGVRARVSRTSDNKRPPHPCPKLCLTLAGAGQACAHGVARPATHPVCLLHPAAQTGLCKPSPRHLTPPHPPEDDARLLQVLTESGGNGHLGAAGTAGCGSAGSPGMHSFAGQLNHTPHPI